MTEKITELLKSKYNGFQEMDVMKAVLKKQLDEMTEDELTYLLKKRLLEKAHSLQDDRWILQGQV